MAFYEHVVIARQDISPQQAEALNDQLQTLITEGGGTVAKIEYWGLRNLTYRIKKNRKGHYSLLAIDAPSAAVKEMERQLSLNEDVLRYLTVRVDELDLELSPVLARRERERERDRDRGERSPGPRGGFEDLI
jgi:small subunit ribosomal protein S6